jgi:hypothetical protein
LSGPAGMPFSIVIPILIFIVLAFVFAVILRRIGVLIAESRETTAFRRSVRDLAGRIDFTLGVIIAKIDALRRQQLDADALVEPLDTTLETLLAYAEEARHLAGPPIIAASRAAFLSEIERADRALQMVEHGCAILVGANQAQRFTEAQTAIKRGYLNVLHAREAIARHVEEIGAMRSADQNRWLSRRRSAGGK